MLREKACSSQSLTFCKLLNWAGLLPRLWASTIHPPISGRRVEFEL